jgi:hypothetical protein
MTPSLRKLVLTTHITVSVAWIGAVAAFLALATAGLSSHNVQVVRVAYPAMELTARFVIVPLAFASLLSGLIQSLGTPWGLFRHYWLSTKFFLTVFATIVLLKKMPLIGSAARRAADMTLSSADLHGAAMPLVVHAAGGILVLLVVTILSVYKPWGLTPYGRRKHQERQYEPTRSVQTVGVEAVSDLDDQTASAGRPRGFKIALAASIGVFLVAAHLAAHLTGHGFHHRH